MPDGIQQVNNLGIQRYVSNELTHFVGRHLLAEDEQYSLLINIIRSGKLGANDGQREYAINLTTTFEEGKMIIPSVVCFCDIPLQDIGLHSQKYSKFGISFPKGFPIEQGANPVHYIAINSKTGMEQRDKGSFFSDRLKMYFEFDGELTKYLYSKHLQGQETGELNKKALHIFYFLCEEIFSFLKPFKVGLADNDPDNYYMEREWRLHGKLSFSINDIYRIFIPEKFASQLKKDLADYSGQVHFL